VTETQMLTTLNILTFLTNNNDLASIDFCYFYIILKNNNYRNLKITIGTEIIILCTYSKLNEIFKILKLGNFKLFVAIYKKI